MKDIKGSNLFNSAFKGGDGQSLAFPGALAPKLLIAMSINLIHTPK